MSVWDDMRALLPDNTEGEISAADMRSIITSLEGEDADNIKGASVQNIVINPGDPQDISDTVAAIVDASSAKRYLITLNPGEHTTKPVGLKPYIYVRGLSKDAAVVMPSDPSDTVFTMSDFSLVDNFIIDGATSGTAIYMGVAGHTHAEDMGITNCNVGIHCDHASAQFLTSCNFNFNVGTGFYVTAGNLTLSWAVLLDDSVFTNIVHVTGATALATVSHVESFSPMVATALRVESGGRCVINNPSVLGATTGLYVTGDSNVVVKSGKFVNCAVGVDVPDVAGSPILELTGLSVVDNTMNVSFQNPNLRVVGMGVCDFFNSSIVEGVTIIAAVVDEAPTDKGLQIFGELKVGTPTIPSESAFGEGDSYAGVGRMVVQSWDGSSWADLTEAASSPMGSPVQFPNGNLNTAIYIASALSKDGDVLKHGGFKIDVSDIYDGGSDITVSGGTTPATAGDYDYYADINGQPAYVRTTADYWLFFVDGRWVLIDSEPDGETKWNEGTHWARSLEGDYQPRGGNTGTAIVVLNNPANPFVLEYFDYDASAWTPINYMMTDADNSYQSYAKGLFEHQGSFQVRYDSFLAEDKSWGNTDPMSLGTPYYWIRIRIDSAITTSPTFEQVKVHSNRTEMNADGYIEFFGKARPFRRLPWDAGLLQAGPDSPQNQDLFVSDNLDRGYIENNFEDGNTDRVGFNTYLPADCDTSSPIRFAWTVTSDASGGNTRWIVRWGYTADGDNVYHTDGLAPGTGPNEQEIITVEEMPSSSYVQATFYVDIDISVLCPNREGSFGDLLWITLERTGGNGADSHGGDVALINVLPRYLTHVLGGHL